MRFNEEAAGLIELGKTQRNTDLLAAVLKVISQSLLNTFCVNKVTILRSVSLLCRVSQEECEILRESVPYVKLYRYNPKHLYPKLNGYGDNGQRKVWTSCISAYCTSTAVAH